MMVVMKQEATQDQIDHVVEKLQAAGVVAHISTGKYRTIIGAIGEEDIISNLPLEAVPGVEKVMRILKPYKLVSREFRSEDTVIDVNGVKIGGRDFTIIAGPCAVESHEQLISSAKIVKELGGRILRGGAYKPRTSPYSFQGLGEEGLKIMAEARKQTGLPIVTEVLDTRDVELVASYADMLQIGARNMQNFILLNEAGRSNKPIMLKRAFGATIEETLMSAEYIAKTGNSKIVICERGIRTFETYTRNTVDISAIPSLKNLSHLPVIVDPSHATGRHELISPISKASLAAGADGIMIEIHPNPENALCDGPQALLFDDFKELIQQLKDIAAVIGKAV